MAFSAVNRWQAFGIHLAISLLIFIALAALIYRWYPGILFQYDGGLEGIQLIAGVDLVIGPLLTLVVFNRAKKSLKADLAIIALLQVVCLIGGMWTVYQTRPVAVVYADGAFRSISLMLLQDAGVNPRSQPLLVDHPWPISVFVVEREQAKPMGIANDRVFTQVEQYQLQNGEFAQRICQEGKTYQQWQWHPAIAAAGELGGTQRYYPAGLSIGSGFVVFDCQTVALLRFLPEMTRPDFWQKLRAKWPW